jgi:hypothetical protein
MPFPTAQTKEAIMMAARSMGMLGPDMERVAMAVALTCEVQFLLPATSITTASGAAGAGAISGASPPVGVVPAAMAQSIYTAMASKGLVGANNFNMCLAISTGICTVIPSLVLFGISPGVGSGVGTAKAVQFNQATFFAMLSSNFASLGMIGQSSLQLALAISEGVCLAMTASLVVPVAGIVGPVGPSPAATAFPSQFV